MSIAEAVFKSVFTRIFLPLFLVYLMSVVYDRKLINIRYTKNSCANIVCSEEFSAKRITVSAVIEWTVLLPLYRMWRHKYLLSVYYFIMWNYPHNAQNICSTRSYVMKYTSSCNLQCFVVVRKAPETSCFCFQTLVFATEQWFKCLC